MKKILTGVCAASMAVAVAGTATADTPNRADFNSAAKYCKALRTSSGSPEAFASAVQAVVGAKKVTVHNAYGKCVSSQAKNEVKDDQQAQSTAQQDCKSERAADPAAFTTKYGTNKNGKNAYGKCVSQKSHENQQQAEQENANEVSAAKQCRAEQKQSDADFSAAHGGKTFQQQYGTNHNGRNAFGKCVSSKSQEMDDQQQGGDQQGGDQQQGDQPEQEAPQGS